MVEPISTILASLGAGVLRNALGWLENATDAKSTGGKEIVPYEWAELAGTSLRYIVLGLGVAYGLGLDPLAAAGSAILVDFVLKALKSQKSK
jgi:hypothetical protein